MKVAVVGSRSFRDWEHFCVVMNEALSPGDIIISGGARGADAFARRYADEYGYEIIEYHADWSKGIEAGFIRNRTIIGECDVCIAFWNGESTGTEHGINLCRAWKKPVRIERFSNAYDVDPDLGDMFE